MLRLENGRSCLYQWDVDQRLEVDNYAVIEVHFDNAVTSPALVCEVYEEDGHRYANIPNILLQQPWAIRAFGCCGSRVRDVLNCRVIRRERPADYVYTETEVRRYSDLERRISALEEGGTGGAGGGITQEELTAQLEGYAKADETNAALEKISTDTNAALEKISEEIETLKGDDTPSEVTYEPDIDGYMRTDGTIWQTTYCYHTDYIPLDGYNRVVAKAYLISSGYALAFFDATRKLIPEASIVGAGGSGMPNHIDMRVPSNAAYCMLSNYLGSDGNNYAFVTLYADDEIVDSVLYGRSINVLGDSISSDDYFTPNYWQLISEKTGCGFNDYAVSASRIATVEGDSPKSFLTRAAEMDTTADAVLVMGGTNDCNLKTLLGEWNSEDESTFYGALNALISLLRTNFPGKPIIFCTPIKRKYDTDNGFPDTMADLKAASATEQITMQHCVLAIKAKCARHGIPVIDLAEHSGFSALTPEYYYSETDNLHPSALGHVRIANMVQAELKKQFTHTVE